MLSVTLLISGYQMTNAFEIPRVSEERLIDQLRAGDGGDMTVASFACCMQKFLVAEKFESSIIIMDGGRKVRPGLLLQMDRRLHLRQYKHQGRHI